MEYIKVKYGYYTYAFRPCDTKGYTTEEVQKLADEKGYMQYEPNRAWLVIPGIGYGYNVQYGI